MRQWRPLTAPSIVSSPTFFPMPLGLLCGAIGTGITLNAIFTVGGGDLLFGSAGKKKDETRKKKDGCPLADTGLFGIVRHPMMFGCFVMLWGAVPPGGYSVGRLLVNTTMTAFIALAVKYHEEPNLSEDFPPGVYDKYKSRVGSMFIPGIL
eukprot:PhF_6_TR40569/c0_g1_i1/m.60831